MQPKPHASITVRQFRSDLRVLEREVAGQLEGETNCCGVTLAQCHTLLELSQREHTLTALADALDLDKSTLSRTVETLVKDGLCERTTAVTDRRSVRLILSPLGRTKVDRINRICDEYYDQLLQQLTESERRQVVVAVRILAEAMRRLRTSGAAKPSCCAPKATPSQSSRRRVATVARSKRRVIKKGSGA